MNGLYKIKKMSLSLKIQTEIDNTINIFINKLSTQYNIEKDELLKIWNGNIVKTQENTVIENTIIDIKKDSNNDLINMNKTELSNICKEKGLKVSGTKAELISRINSCSDGKKVEKIDKVEKKDKSPPVVKKLVEKLIPNITIKRNKFDNFEHQETGFVFNNKTQKVYGKQNEDGTIEDLTSEDIDLCNKYKFSYIIPDNLDKKNNLKKVEDVKELEDIDVEDDNEVDEDFEEEEFEEFEEEEEEEEYYEDD
jgi:hypothetical protein